MNKACVLKSVYFIVLVYIALVFCTCTDAINDKNEIGLSNKLIDQKLGDSKLIMSIPADYKFKLTQGPDFGVYYLSSVDTTRKGIAAAGIYFGGFPRLFGPDSTNCKTDSLHSKLLKVTATWLVYECDTTFFAETIIQQAEYGKVHAFISAKKRQDIEFFVNRFASLRETQ